MYNSILNNKSKFIFLIVGLLLISFFYYINITISKTASIQLKNQVQTLVEVYNNKIQENEIDLNYLKFEFIPLLRQFKIPMIITTKNSDGTIDYQDLEIQYSKEVLDAAKILEIDKENISKKDELAIQSVIPIYSIDIEKMVENMDKIYEPLTVISINNEPIVQIHYSDSISNNRFNLIPFIGFGFFLLIFLLILLGLSIIYSSESNFIYAGMAKETAHQLGTPISSLLGWLDLLKEDKLNKDEIINSMENEINHIQNISNKFNKIGSKTKLVKINVSDIINDVVSYFIIRLPKSKKINIEIKCKEDFFILGDKLLIYWAFENIIKNSIESFVDKIGNIKIDVFSENNKVIILFSDDGKEIEPKNKNKIFKPGYSSKKRGWGLGLSLTKRIIEYIHNGNIKLLKSNKSQKIFKVTFKSFYL